MKNTEIFLLEYWFIKSNIIKKSDIYTLEKRWFEVVIWLSNQIARIWIFNNKDELIINERLDKNNTKAIHKIINWVDVFTNITI